MFSRAWLDQSARASGAPATGSSESSISGCRIRIRAPAAGLTGALSASRVLVVVQAARNRHATKAMRRSMDTKTPGFPPPPENVQGGRLHA